MADVDLFGNPIKGDQHTTLFKKLTTRGERNEKELYELEHKRMKERIEAMKYAKKREQLKEQQLRMSIKQFKNPRILQASKRKIGILTEIFK